MEVEVEKKRKDYEIEEEFRTFEEYETSLHAVMDIAGEMVHIIESATGKGARALCYTVSKGYGAKLGMMLGKKEGLEEAIGALNENQDWWNINLWSKHDEALIEESDGVKKFKIVIRDCTVRQTLLRVNLPQRSTMCHLTNGYIIGALEAMLGVKGNIEITHAGNNACLKEITLTNLKQRNE